MFKRDIATFSRSRKNSGTSLKEAKLEKLLREHNTWFLVLLGKTIPEILTLEKAIIENPKDAEAHYLLGQIYLEHKKKYDDIELFFVGFQNNRYTIQYKNSIILQSYPEYQQERINDGKPTYIELYKKQNIYL